MRLSVAQVRFREQHKDDVLEDYDIRPISDVKYSITKKATGDNYIIEIVGEQGEFKYTKRTFQVNKFTHIRTKV